MQVCRDLPDLSLNLNDDENEVFRLLEVIKPEWIKDQVHIKNLSGGYSCHMLRCFVDSRESVTVRVRNKLDGIWDPSYELQIVKVMSSKGYFPPLLAVFQNGFCYEYISGRPVYMKDSPVIGVDEEQLRVIAHEMANIHSVVVPGFSYTRSTLFEFAAKVLAEVQPRFEGCPSKEELIQEIQLVEEFVATMQSPLVTTHGDPHAANMVWNEQRGKITYVDWELTLVAPRAYDIAYFIYSFEFFGHFVNISVKNPNDIERKFCVHYLERWNELCHKPSPTEEEIEQLLLELKYFSLVVKAMWMIFVARFKEIEATVSDIVSFWQFNYNRYVTAKEELIGIKTFGRPNTKSEFLK